MLQVWADAEQGTEEGGTSLKLICAVVFGPILFFALLYAFGAWYKRYRRLNQGAMEHGTFYPTEARSREPLQVLEENLPQHLPSSTARTPSPSLPAYQDAHVKVRRVSADSQADDFVEMTQVRADGPSNVHAPHGGAEAVLARKSSIESLSSGSWSVRRVSAGGNEDTFQVQKAECSAPMTAMTPQSPQEVLHSPIAHPFSTQGMTHRNKKGLSLISMQSETSSASSQRPHPFSQAGLSSAQLMSYDASLQQTVSSARPQVTPTDPHHRAPSEAPQISPGNAPSPFAGWMGFGRENDESAPKSAPERRAAWSMILEAASLREAAERGAPDTRTEAKGVTVPSTAPLTIRKRSQKEGDK